MKLVSGMCIAVAVVFLPFAYLEFDFQHDGLMMKTAMDLASGQRIFRDTFTQYGPLSSWIQALALVVFGVKATVLKTLSILALTTAIGFFCMSWRYFLSSRELIVSVVL